MKLYVRGSFNEKKLWAILDFCTWTNLFSPVEAVPYPPCRSFILPDALKNTLKNPLNYFFFNGKKFQSNGVKNESASVKKSRGDGGVQPPPPTFLKYVEDGCVIRGD